MEINVCTVTRDLPPENEVREVIGKVCEKANLNPDQIRLNYIGGDRRQFFPRRGIKLKGIGHWNIQMYVGCKSETVEAYLWILDTQGKARAGQEVFEVLNRICISRVFCLADEEIRQLRESKNGKHDTDFMPVQPESPEIISDKMETTQESTVLPPIEPAPRSEEPELDLLKGTTYEKYFDDPTKLHLTACALTSIVNEDCQLPFPFESFQRALKESNVPKSAGLPMSLIRSFLCRQFIVRINPNSKSARYNITANLVAFTRGPVPTRTVEIPRLKVKSLSTEPSQPDEVSGTSLGQMQKHILKLQQANEKHQHLVSQLQTTQAKLTELQETKIEEIKRDIDGQIKNLEQRLHALKKEKEELSRKKLEIQNIKQKISELNKQANDPDLKRSISEFEKLRKFFS
jgi:hypothetical protein